MALARQVAVCDNSRDTSSLVRQLASWPCLHATKRYRDSTVDASAPSPILKVQTRNHVHAREPSINP